MMVAVRDAVTKLVGVGKSREEIIAAKPTAALDAVWDGGVLDPDTYVGHIYDSVTATSEMLR
ncbi:MAG: hypothetical protein F4Z37_07665 [Rhodothermaceae bacterium]|nr:hypothetical protein [Rhodothermaceae bacterium]